MSFFGSGVARGISFMSNMKYLFKSPALPECRPCQLRFCLDRQIAAKARRPRDQIVVKSN
jgi:hypothetical protein